MNAIKKVSFFFRIIFLLAFIAMPVMLMISWIYAPNSFSMLNGTINLISIPAPYVNAGSHGTAVLHTMTVIEKMQGFFLSSIPMGLNLFIVFSLIKLFRLYEQGEIFSLNTVKHTRNIGYVLIIGQAIYPFYQFAMGFIITSHNPPGYRFAAFALDQTNFGIVLTALLVILISWIMAEGCKLHDEMKLTV